jgi:hypothetical protein
MKMVSKIALTAALVAGLNGVALVAPAIAKKEEAPAGPTMSKEARAAAVDAQTALNATPKDLVKAEAALNTLDSVAKSDYERYISQSFRLGLVSAQAQGQSEAAFAAKVAPVLDLIIANPATPKTDLGIRYAERADMFRVTKEYAKAAQYYERARDFGYANPNLLLNIASTKTDSGDVTGGVHDLEAAITAEKAAGRKPPEAWYKYAIVHLNKLGRTDDVDTWTAAWLSEYGTAPNWRTAIYTFGFQGPAASKYSKNRIDLYRLLWATKSETGLGEYIQYADAALAIGLPIEAKTVIEEGNASGAIPAGNAVAKEDLAHARTAIAGATSPAMKEKGALAAPKGDLAQQAGDSYFGARNYAKAVEMYRLCETKGAPDADRNNLHLGMALALSGDRAGAKAALSRVVADPNKSIARLWTVFVDTPPAA